MVPSLAMTAFQGLSLALVIQTSQIKDQNMSEPMIRFFLIAPSLNNSFFIAPSLNNPFL